jgi:hypothetical protein
MGKPLTAYERDLNKLREAIRRKPVQGCPTEAQARIPPLPSLDGVSDDGWREQRDNRRDDVDSREEARRFRRG